MTTSSTAISAQGSTLSIGSGVAPAPASVSSVTPSVAAATPGNPGTTLITTTAAHGLSDGAQVTPAALAGTGAATLNGNTYAISVVSPTTFTIQVNTFGLIFTATTGTIQGTAYLKVGNFKTYNGLDGQASEIDVTNLDSQAKEIRLGLVDFGQIQVEVDHNLQDVGQARVQNQYLSGAITPFLLSLPNGDTASFNAFARKFSLQGGVDQVVKRQLDLRISGPVTWC